MHPRVSLHQVALITEPTADFLDICRSIGVQHCTLAAPCLQTKEARSAARESPVQIGCINHLFALHPDLERDTGKAAANLLGVIEVAAEVGAPAIYLLTGGRGALSWEAAAQRFAALLAPCRDAAQRAGIRLLVENASPLNADIHMAHTLPDAVRLARMAAIDVCVELHACWTEADLRGKLADAMPLAGLVAAGAHMWRQIRVLDIDDPDQCLKLFKSNSVVGLLIFLGLLGGGVWATLSPHF